MNEILIINKYNLIRVKTRKVAHPINFGITSAALFNRSVFITYSLCVNNRLTAVRTINTDWLLDLTTDRAIWLYQWLNQLPVF